MYNVKSDLVKRRGIYRDVIGSTIKKMSIY